MVEAISRLSLAVSGTLILCAGSVHAQQDNDRPPDGLSKNPYAYGPSVVELTPEAVQVAAGNTRFAFDLYKHLRHQNGNLLFSPYSISQAFGMTYAGARGRTEQQMAATLRFPLDQKELHPAFKLLAKDLRSRGESGGSLEGVGFRLRIANTLWGQQGMGFLPGFLGVLAGNYDAGMRLVDFQRNFEGARVTINDWVCKSTEGRIKDLLAPGVLNPGTRLVLTNAIYFKASWQQQFPEGATRPDDFHLLDGTKIRAPMMSQETRFGYSEGNGVQAVELGYAGAPLSMVVLLPRAGQFERVEASLDDGSVTSILGSLKSTKVLLTMPKFEYESSFSLSQALVRMGMKDAFDAGKADFSGMTGKRDLKIDDALHKAFILVDERGTEAAAATSVAIGLTSVRKPEPPVVVRIDRPFIYLIRDKKAGTILFMGRVLNPTG
ncbi:MAG: serpin family protein [Phycisphaerae bacterium]|nr:serpin family protein [Phycisphaerae bacterium]